MSNIFHCLIIEGNEKEVTTEAKKICVSILGDNFKDKVKKNTCSDIILVNQKDSKNSIGVDEIRKINSDVIVKPVECKSKIYVLKNAQKMTEQAQNALLKTIEEPPPHVYFLILCDNSEKLLNTVKSRSRIIKLVSKKSNKIEDCHKSFTEFFVKKNNFEALKILDKCCSKRENLKNFLESAKICLIDKIKNGNVEIDSKTLEKLDYCIDLLQYNLNVQLVAQYLFID